MLRVQCGAFEVIEAGVDETLKKNSFNMTWESFTHSPGRVTPGRSRGVPFPLGGSEVGSSWRASRAGRAGNPL